MQIRELRKLCGMTQRELAAKYNIPFETLRGIEKRGGGGLTETLLNRAVMEDLDENFPKPPYCLGFNIRRLIDYTHITTQKQFSDKYNIPLTQLNNWVTGYQKPRKYILLLLERFVREDMNEPWKSYNCSKV